MHPLKFQHKTPSDWLIPMIKVKKIIYIVLASNSIVHPLVSVLHSFHLHSTLRFASPPSSFNLTTFKWLSSTCRLKWMSLHPIHPQFTLPFLVFHNFQQTNCAPCLVNSTFTPLSLSCSLSLVWFMNMCSIFKQSLTIKIQTFSILCIALWFSWITHSCYSQRMGPLKCEIKMCIITCA
jgi:hypothetical protein